MGIRTNGENSGQGLVCYDQRYRVRVLEEGEVALNTAEDDPGASSREAPHRITLKNGMEIHISADNTVDIRAGTSRISMDPGGGIEITGDVRISGSLTAQGAIVSGEEVRVKGIALSSHRHPGDSGGSTGRPIT